MSPWVARIVCGLYREERSRDGTGNAQTRHCGMWLTLLRICPKELQQTARYCVQAIT
jgi:hypothetical protein